MRLIVETFWNNPLARVVMPLAEDIEMFKAAFAEQHPLLNDCWATIDGLHYICKQQETWISRNVFIMNGQRTTMLHPSFAFVPME